MIAHIRAGRVASAVVVGSVGLVGCKAEEVFHARITFRETDAGISGFDCNLAPATAGVPSPGPLANRVLAACGGPGKVRVVVDLLPTAASVRCDTDSLTEFCDQHDCLPSRRVCFEEPVDVVPAGPAASGALAAAIKRLAGRVVLRDAPSGFAVMRVIATQQSCEEIGPATVLDCSRLLGCAWSCPVDLSSFTGDLRVDMDVGSRQLNESLHIADAVCALTLVSCARTPFSRQNQCVGPGETQECH